MDHGRDGARGRGGPAAPMARALQRLALAEAMDPACDGALRGDLAAVQQHLQAASKLEGYSINAKGTRARTPLYQACLGRSPEVAEWLLAQGVHWVYLEI